MKKIIVGFFIIGIFLVSCSYTSKVKTTQTTSKSCGTLIKVNAKNEMQGIIAEHKWLDKHYPGYQKISQALLNCDGIPVDVIKIKTSKGETKDIYFDISSFFGKY